MIAKSQFQEYQFHFFKRKNDDLLQKIIFRQRLKFTHDNLKVVKKNAD